MTDLAAAPAAVPGYPPGGFRPGGDAAPAVRRLLAQARFDAAIQLRNGEQVLLTLVLPALLLVTLVAVEVPDLGPGRRIDVVVPGILALAVMSASFTGQAIMTGFDRRHGVLRLLATTPLGRGGLLGGRVLAVLAVETLQVTVLGGLGLLLGWRPDPVGAVLALPVLALGTAAFVTAGLLLAGTARAEAVLAAANLIWVLLLAGGGVVVPAERMGPLGDLARALPSGALGEGARAAFQEGRPVWGALAVLAGWALAATVAAIRWFRWD